MPIAVELENIIFGYDKERILNDISIDIQSQKFTTIIGPNGSGKSTLLKVISSLISPDNGIVRLDGIDIKNMSQLDIARKVAVVPQENNIEYRFTVQDIVMMGRYPHLGRFQTESIRDYKLVGNALEMTNTIHLKDRYINELSGGEKQRVIIARALAQQPKIILLDEPTSYLDIQHQVEILELLENLNKEEGLTVIAILHDINLAARFSNNMILLKDGTVIGEGNPREVITLENLKNAYEIDMIISKNPYSNSPYVIPLSRMGKGKIIKEEKIHVICGGGTGTDLIQRLTANGYKVTTGVLNIGDSDWKFSQIYDIETIEEAPFTDISDNSYSSNISAIERSGIVILTSIPVGSGNLKNLEAVHYALNAEKRVIFLDQYVNQVKYDYTTGDGEKLIMNIRNNCRENYKSIQELLLNL